MHACRLIRLIRLIRPLTLILLSLPVTLSVAAGEVTPLPSGSREALRELYADIKNHSHYTDVRLASVEKLKHQLAQASPADSAYYLGEIARAYDGFNVDSCITYLDRGISLTRRLGMTKERQRMESRFYARLPIIGITTEAMRGMQRLRQELMPENLEVYHESLYQLMGYMVGIYPPSRARDSYWRSLNSEADTLYNLLAQDPDTPFKHLIEAHELYIHGDINGYVAQLHDVVEQTPQSHPDFARAAAGLGDYYHGLGNKEQAIYHYAIAAQADLRNGTREGVALLRLAEMLFDQGDIDDSYRLLDLALEQSVASGARIRAIEVYEALPRVNEAFNKTDRRRLTWLAILAATLALALAVLAVMILRRRREVASLTRLRNRLSESNRVKEQNMARFLDLTSIYADRLEEVMRLARRKLAAGQIEELHDLLKSESVTRNQTRLFCQLFDNAFLHLYPDFVHDVNALLAPDARIETPAPREMTPELRIAAFQRLGIMDAQRISGFLGIAVKSVYTYRNRTRARALNRDTFDHDLMLTGLPA